MTLRHLPPLAESIDAALREAVDAGALPPCEQTLRRIVEIACSAVADHSPRTLADPARVRLGYALRDRDERVRGLRGQVATAHLAERFGLSERQVYRILADVDG